MIYYKGEIIDRKEITGYYKIGRSITSQRYSEFSTEFMNRSGTNDMVIVKNLLGRLRSFYSDYDEVSINDEDLISAFKRMKIFIDFSNIFEYSDEEEILGDEIVFTKVIDKDGRVFAREIRTGVVFPLLDESTFTTSYSLTKFDKSDEEAYDNYYALDMSIGIKDDFIKRADNVVVCEDVANEKEVKNYLDSSNPECSTWGDYADESEIIEQSQCNVFAGPIEEKEEKDLSLSEENNYVGQIRYYLSCLKKIDVNEHKRYEGYLEYLINGYEDKELNTPITINDLKSVLSRLKFLCLFNERLEKGVISSLVRIEEDSLMRIRGDESKFKEFSISKLDSLYELFLENKTMLTLKDQDKVLYEFAKCYMLKIKEYNMSKTDVLRTHFSDLIYYAIGIDNDFASSVGKNVISIINEIGNEEDEISLTKRI